MTCPLNQEDRGANKDEIYSHGENGGAFSHSNKEIKALFRK